MDSAGLTSAVISRKIENLAARLRRRELVGSHDVALEVVSLYKEVINAARISSFEGLVEALHQVGRKLQDAGRKEPAITNMTLRNIKFLREEYTTALHAHMSTIISNDPSTSASAAGTPFAAYPLDTSASMPAFTGAPQLKRQTSHFPFDEEVSSSNRRAENASMDPVGGLPSTSLQPIGAKSILELLGHKRGIEDTILSRSTSPTGSQSPTTPYSSLNTPLYSPHPGKGSLNPQQQQHRIETEFSKKAANLKPLFLDAVTELFEELAITRDQISNQALEHIHSSEFILTCGYSKTVEDFLKAAARKRKITVIVAETSPTNSGKKLALSLSTTSSIQTLLVPDSSIFTMISSQKVSKVIIGAQTVFADASVVSVTGSLNICKIAKQYRIPVIVLAGTFKISPDFNFYENSRDHLDFASPYDVLHVQGGEQDDDLTEQELQNSSVDIEVLNPFFDVLTGDLISLFITNIGAHPTSMIFRLLKELYE